MNHALTVDGLTVEQLLAFHRATFGAARMDGDGAGGEGDGGGGKGPSPATFTQADVDRIVRERVQRERAKFADYDDLKQKASQGKTSEDRITALEQELSKSQLEGRRSKVQARYSISDEDAELFLTGTDDKTLEAQAKRLADRDSQRKKNGNHVPQEGPNPKPGPDEMRDFTRKLFGRGN